MPKQDNQDNQLKRLEALKQDFLSRTSDYWPSHGALNQDNYNRYVVGASDNDPVAVIIRALLNEGLINEDYIPWWLKVANRLGHKRLYKLYRAVTARERSSYTQYQMAYYSAVKRAYDSIKP